mmetsp:Transcript_107488/g.195507  ORF Transcript_107488/g.195507 Transcript_107488/m.195507 type:complete len:400 (-) Transcript_107488:199-1398(-)
MGYYNQPKGCQWTVDLNAFEKLLRSLPVEVAIEALDLLETLTRNVIQHPTEDKFRRVRTTNEKLAPLFGTPGIFDVMAEMGWQKEGDFVVLPKEAKLDFPTHVVKILEAKSYFGKQRESKKKSERLQQNPNKAGLLQQLEIDRRERAAAQACKEPRTAPAAPAAGYPAAASAPPPTAPTPARAEQAVHMAPAPVAPTAAAEVASTPMPSKDPELKDKMWQIETMGFPSSHAQAALLAYDGSVERSIEALCDGWTPPAVPANVDEFIGNETKAPSPVQAPQAKAAAVPKSASAFERREDKEQKRKEADMSLQELRAMQKEKFKDFKQDPNAGQSDAYKRPASTANGSQEAGWFDWLWGGSSSTDDSNGRGPGGGGQRPRPTGARIKTVSDLPKPVRPAGG